jgi:hypothetical protein
MMTLRQFSRKPESVSAITSWYLADLGEARGKQELFTRQSPQKLRVLREHALIESAVSSNRIEGVEVDQSRVRTDLRNEGKLSAWGAAQEPSGRKRVLPPKKGKNKGNNSTVAIWKRAKKCTQGKARFEVAF